MLIEVMSLFIRCLLLLDHSVWGFCVRPLICCAVLCVLFSFEIISLGENLVALLLLSSWCHEAVIVVLHFHRGAVVWSALCECAMHWSYSFEGVLLHKKPCRTIFTAIFNRQNPMF